MSDSLRDVDLIALNIGSALPKKEGMRIKS
jgi:hypothetical protein